jgi:hypothetical protein
MIKNFTLGLLLFFSICGTAQSIFYPGTLTRNDKASETIYFKGREYAITNNNELNVYSAASSKNKMILNASDFVEIKSDNENLVIETAIVKNYDSNKKQILRKLVGGENSLYVFYENEKPLYVHKKGEQFTLLLKTSENNQINFREWLFKNFNPNNKKPIEFNNVAYKRSSLIAFYIESDPTAIELEQENKVKFFNLGAHVGYSNYNIGVSNQNENVSSNGLSGSNVRFGFKTFFHIDEISNHLTFFAGIDYHTSLYASGNSVLFPQSNLSRRDATTEVALHFISCQLGFKYNIHFNNFTISPSISFEPFIYIGDRNASTIRDDGSIFFDTEIRDNPKAFNIGLHIDAFQNFYAFVEYGTITEISTFPRTRALTEFTSKNFSRLTFALGYKFL